MDSPSEIRVVEKNSKILKDLISNDNESLITGNGFFGAIQAVYYAKVTFKTYKKYRIPRLLDKVISGSVDEDIKEAAQDLIDKIKDMEKLGDRYQYDYQPLDYTPSSASANIPVDQDDKEEVINDKTDNEPAISELLTRIRTDPVSAKMFNLPIIDKNVISDNHESHLPLPKVIITSPQQTDQNDNGFYISDKNLVAPEIDKNPDNKQLIRDSSRSERSKQKKHKTSKVSSPEVKPEISKESKATKQPSLASEQLGPKEPSPISQLDLLSPGSLKEPPVQINLTTPRKRSSYKCSPGKARAHPCAPVTVTPVKTEPLRIRPYLPPIGTDKSRPKQSETTDKKIIVTDKSLIRDHGKGNEEVADKMVDKKVSAVISDEKKSDLKRILDLSDDDSLINEPISDKKKKLTKEAPIKLVHKPTHSPLQHYNFDVLKLHDILPYDYEKVRPYLITLSTQDLKNFMDRNPNIADSVDCLFRRRCQMDFPHDLPLICVFGSWRELHDYSLINSAL